jgi:anti-sigma regulatory factor (Ser/Thr protein kinase)
MITIRDGEARVVPDRTGTDRAQRVESMAIMTVRRHDPDPYAFQRTLLAVPASVGLLRDYAETVLIKWGLDHRIDDTKVVVSELVTNAAAEEVARGREITFRIAFLRDMGLISVEVTDPARSRPHHTNAADTDIHGRGLLIVQALAHRTGYRDEPGGGKTIWATLPTYLE